MSTDNPKGLRLWPGVAIVLVQWTAWFGLPILNPDLVIYAVGAGLAGGLALIVWWLFFSRALLRRHRRSPRLPCPRPTTPQSLLLPASPSSLQET